MTEPTRRRVEQRIRHFRALLTAEEHWIRTFEPRDDIVREMYREVNFWRNVLREAEDRLTRTATQQEHTHGH
jgi:hypothetical protein